jgi:hypothetical protein
MRLFSLNARAAYDAATTDEVEVVLFRFEHASLVTPLHFSTDPTERISTEPLAYGTRSTWMCADPQSEPFLFILAAAEVPGDMEDGPATGVIVMDNIDAGIIDVLTSFTDRATCHMAVVLASSPDAIEAEFRDLKLIAHSADTGEISLQLSRVPIEQESVPMDRMTKERFPGIYR